MVNEKLLYKGAILSYNANNTEDLSDNFKLRINSPTIDAYVNDNTKQIIISIRGTKINDINDIKADISLPFNKLHNTNRFNTDLNIMNKVVDMYDPKVYDYYMTSHSLGNAIMNELMRRFPFVKGSIGYNGAFQTKDLKSNNPKVKRMYIDKDPLYRKGGYLFDPKVVLRFKSKSFFDWFFNRISGVKEAISAHSLKSFEDHYKGKGKKDVKQIERFLKISRNGLPSTYVPSSLSKEDKIKQIRSIILQAKRPKLKSFKGRKSKWTKLADRYFGNIKSIKGMSKKLKVSEKGLLEIINKGKKAYFTSGSRPNQTPESWGRARLYSVLFGGQSRSIDKHIVDKYKIPLLSYKGGCACCEKHKGQGRKIISRTPLKTKKRDKRRSYVERISRLK